MGNFSQVSHFTLGAYFDTGPFKWLSFLIIMSVYILIVLSNLLLIVVICLNRTLHEPMYLFLCSLFVNELYGSTALFPFLLLQILKDFHTIPAPFCFLQIFSMFSYGHVEFHTLAVMSYDRYLAICFPLHYHSKMTHTKVFILIALTWLLLFIAIIILISLSAPLPLCGNIINKVYCDNYSVVKLACFDTTVNNIYGFIHLFLITLSPSSLILFTYFRIFKVCFRGSKQTRQKALSTCTPHLASLLNFSFGVGFESIQSRFNMSSVPNLVRIILSLYFLTVQPLFNPVMYGLKMSKIRSSCKKTLFCLSLAGESCFASTH
ncbi:olfactory receptor 142-like [Periophthalmus magnuspinnatus]|uniref:olfactory receptor 142-like n=1 Tax=Periophthalmus magnuspinnatus TaxID=409849 RepID=UPI0024370662|nr:olfactory receptor 142-like [Periophthalmus magnuspinnatus]